MFPFKRFFLFFLAGALIFSACSALAAPPITTTPLPTRPGALTPFRAPTSVAISTPTNAATPTPLPSPTPTPRTHTVKKGEDMGGIAYRYHISLQELMAANPTVTPNMMSVGTVLNIPYSKTPEALTGDQSTSAPSTPTPLPLELGKLNCAQTQDGGAWCFLPIHNPHDYPLEGVSAVVRAADKDGRLITPLAAFLPLDVLPAGATLPASAYFPPEALAALAGPRGFSAELVSALPSRDDGRYLPAVVKNQKVLVSEDGLSAEIHMELALTKPEGPAKRVWVAAVAYDAQGSVVGVRRWENPEGQDLEIGTPYPVVMRVYSVSTAIDRVALFAETRP